MIRKQKTLLIKRMLCIMLVAMLIVIAQPIASISPEAGAAWDGQTLASTYIYSGTGTSTDPFIIPAVPYLAKLAQVVNNGSLNSTGLYFKLSADLDFGNFQWTPIGSSTNTFRGNFDGNGYKILNLKINTSSQNSGLFGVCYNAAVRNLTIENVSITTTASNSGALCGDLRSSVLENVKIRGSIFIGIANESAIGGIGGMCGLIRDSLSAVNCSVQSTGTEKTIRGSSYIGGFVGTLYSGAQKVFEQCSVDGLEIMATSTSETDTYCGGFFGDFQSGITYNTIFKGCSVLNSRITGFRQIGGFGYSLRDYSAAYGCCVSYCSIVNKSYVGSFAPKIGGLFGYTNNNAYLSINNCYTYITSISDTNTVSDHTYVGSMVGYNEIQGSNLYSTGDNTQINYYYPVTLSDGTVTKAEGLGNSAYPLAETYNAAIANSAQIFGGELGYNLNLQARKGTSTSYGCYFTQKDNNFTGGLPVPSSVQSATCRLKASCQNEDSKFHFSPLMINGISMPNLSLATYYKYVYANCGQTGFISAQPSSGWEYYVQVLSADSSYDLSYSKNVTSAVLIPSSAQYVSDYSLVFHVTAVLYNIIYKSGSSAVSPEGAPLTFSVLVPASLTSASWSRQYWRFNGWKNSNGVILSSVSVANAGYADITLTADWTLSEETDSSDGKVYKQIYSFEHLEEFRDLVNSGQASINGRLIPINVTYPKLTLNPKTGVATLTTGTCSSFSALGQTAYDRLLTYRTAPVASGGLGESTLVAQRNIAAATDEYAKWGYAWNTPIGTSGCHFTGTIDGTGTVVSGVDYGGAATSQNNSFGLIGYGEDFTVKNLTLSGGTLSITTTDPTLTVYASPFAAFAAGSPVFTDCTVSVPVDLTGYTGNLVYAGGLCASHNDLNQSITISRCTATGSVKTGNTHTDAGSFVGNSSAYIQVTDSWSSCALSTTSTTLSSVLGGFVGVGQLTVVRSYFNGTITNNSVSGSSSGTFVGDSNPMVIDSCYNSGKGTFTRIQGTALTTAQFNTGEAAYLLQKNAPTQTWGQTSITGSLFPILTQNPAYAIRKVTVGSNGSASYFNMGKATGDTDGNFAVDSADVTRIMRGSVKASYEDGGTSDTQTADLNGDGVIDSLDAFLLNSALSGASVYKLP